MVNIGFGQEMKELVSIEIHFTHLIWHSDIWLYLIGITLYMQHGAVLIILAESEIDFELRNIFSQSSSEGYNI